MELHRTGLRQRYMLRHVSIIMHFLFYKMKKKLSKPMFLIFSKIFKKTCLEVPCSSRFLKFFVTLFTILSLFSNWLSNSSNFDSYPPNIYRANSIHSPSNMLLSFKFNHITDLGTQVGYRSLRVFRCKELVGKEAVYISASCHTNKRCSFKLF